MQHQISIVRRTFGLSFAALALLATARPGLAAEPIVRRAGKTLDAVGVLDTRPANAPALQIPYDRYLDQVLGGWIGKSAGGAIGARFEGYKGWVEVSPDKMFPEKMPPNDDLDLQVVWLGALEQMGAATRADDLAAAWLEGCWYPFNEYGIFRRNWRLGIHPPASGRYTNQFWESGMGCPIRSEIWGYIFPGAPGLAARYAAMDGSLDHTAQSIGAEQMFAAMQSMAFIVPDMRSLAMMFMHYLPENTPIARMTRMAFQCHEEHLSLRDARDRIMVMEGFPESCDAQANVPFTFLGLLYGDNDMQKTILAAVACGYDTDCTAATSGAIVGQILGASRIPESIKKRVGDELVMGIKYRRPQMTLTALARDTARIGVLLAKECDTGVELKAAPEFAPLPATAHPTGVRLTTEYTGLPAAAPGETVRLSLRGEGTIPENTHLTVEGPPGWTIAPKTARIDDLQRTVSLVVTAPADVKEWPMRNLFTAKLDTTPPTSYSFGIAGAGLWRFLGVYYDAVPDEKNPVQTSRRFNQHFVSLAKAYIPEPVADADALFKTWSRKLGRPAVVASYEHEIDLSHLIGLRGPYCAYLARTVISPDERSVYLMVGNNDGYRLYLNGQKVGEMDESTWWAPFNNAHKVKLRAGENQLLVKLLKRGDDLKFTLGIRADTGACGGGFNCEDWTVDLADAAP